MSEKYCPAGKCECHNYRDNPHGKYCAHSFESVGNFEQCPWPSRQVPVEPKQSDYDRGRSDMKREIGAKVEALPNILNATYDGKGQLGLIFKDDALAAIEAVK